MRFLFVLSLSIISIIVQGQENQLIDSLRSTYSKSKSTSDRIATSNKLGIEYADLGDVDSSNIWLNLSLDLSLSTDDNSMIARNYMDLAENSFKIDGDMASALDYYNKALPYNLKLGDPSRIGNNYFNIGKVVNNQGNGPLSLENFQKCLPYFEQLKDSTAIAQVYNSMGIVFSKQEDFEQSIFYHEKAIGIQKRLGLLSNVGINYNNIGLTYKKMGDLEKALVFYRMGLETEKEIGFLPLKGALMNNIGTVMELQGHYDSAIYYQLEALFNFEQGNYGPGFGWAYKGLGSTYLAKSQIDNAIRYGEKAFKKGEDTDELDLISQSSEILAKAYASSGKYQEAYYYQNLFKQYSDSLLNAEKIKKVATMEYAYQYQKANELQALELQKQEELYRAQLDREVLLRNGFITGLVVIIFFLGLLYYSYRQKQKANEVLEEKNKIISEQASNLKELNGTKDKFFSIISHDLRGPMNIFQGLSYMIKAALEDKEYEELDKFADNVREISLQVSELLDNLLTWAVQQQNEFPYNPEKINLKSCIDENIAIFSSIAAAKQIEFKSDIRQDAMLWADKNSLMTILRNLISNAMKFTPSNGKVSLSCDTAREYTVVRVKDTGKGIPKDKINTLFDEESIKFSHGTSGEKGVGLGLQLVRDFVKLNNGKIEVDSSQNEGTIFSVYLPSSGQAA